MVRRNLAVCTFVMLVCTGCGVFTSNTSNTVPSEAVDGENVGGDSSNVVGNNPVATQLGESIAGEETSSLSSDGSAASEECKRGSLLEGYVAPLTGLPTDDRAVVRRRAAVVKVGNNNKRSRPQAGLDAADIVVETLIEGVSTRFIAVYHSEIPTRIGPIRSARSSDFNIIRGELNTPYFIYSGGNDGVLSELRAAINKGVLLDASSYVWASYYQREPQRVPPYNLYFKPYTPNVEGVSFVSKLDNTDSGNTDFVPSKFFTRVPPASYLDAVCAKSPVDTVGLLYRTHPRGGTSVAYVWDIDRRGWVRIQDGALHMTETDSGVVEIVPNNVVVLNVEYVRSASNGKSPQAVSHGSGEAWVLTQGEVLEATWERAVGAAGYRLTGKTGDEIALSVGKTWVLLANSSKWPFSYAKVERITGSAGEKMLSDARLNYAQQFKGL